MLDALPPAQPLKDPSQASVDYCRAIWTAVCERSGKDPERTSSSADFSLTYSWWTRKVPLRVILRGIADTKGSGSTVSYYRNPVEQAISYWSRALA